MTKPHFIFTKQKNSFSVYVENLEMLSVEQIQEIQHFVSERSGYFDFDTYTFTINKNLRYQEFIKLLKNLHIEATTREALSNIQKSARINFGKYKGMLYSELPDSYLLWLKKNYTGSEREIICDEVAKRKL